MSEWFKDWFNTKFYTIVYKHRDIKDARKLFELVDKIAKEHNVQDVLDLCCGAGRHSVLFAEEGYNVTGVDLSDFLLQKARINSFQKKLDIKWIKKDVRELSLNVQFDLVASLFTSWGYFENDETNYAVFGTVANHLKDKGLFVFDFINSYVVEKTPESETIRLDQDVTIKEKKMVVDNRITKEIILIEGETINRYVESIELYKKAEIIEAAAKYGLQPLKIYGNYAGEDYEENTSDRLIIIFSKG